MLPPRGDAGCPWGLGVMQAAPWGWGYCRLPQISEAHLGTRRPLVKHEDVIMKSYNADEGFSSDTSCTTCRVKYLSWVLA